MVKSAQAVMVAVLLGFSGSQPGVCGEYQLFTPRPLEGELVPPEKGKGILVERITIKPGDTLKRLSRKYRGRAAYFPQILLFNDIKNPDLILAGKELLVPVDRQPAAGSGDAGQGEGVVPDTKKTVVRTRPLAAKPAKTAADKTGAGKMKAKEAKSFLKATVVQDEQNSYQQALTTYRQGNFTAALAAFSRFVEQYPASPLAPDASLYKAECLFKLAGE